MGRLLYSFGEEGLDFFRQVRSKNELISTVFHTILINRPVSEVIPFSYFATVSYILQYGFYWINNRANAQNIAALCAWSAKHCYKETHYCNDDSRDKILHSTTVAYLHITFLMITGLVVS